ncbi:nitrate/nitrite transporter NarK [Litorimonas taeanensis]|uniref:Nitrate/nitrite transporter NarK n=1 Tax=Litorimonas taeanensis TaxID=568099 RepID=A0A420WMH7_9PROT|nr:MFS transporter [Litorimonas taeanensis]RKQ72190.1 nitrate/nitrite transporter NarK [Litorimonas taeanensis]
MTNPATTHETLIAETDTSQPFPKAIVSWGIVAAFFIAYIFSFIDRMIIGLLVESIKEDLVLTDTQIGLLQGLAFAIFYTVAGIPIGRLIDRAPRMKIVALGIAVWSIMTAICAGVSNFWQFFVARMGVGVGEAVLSPAAYSVISDSFPKNKIGLPMGVYGLGSAIGAGLAFMLGAVVVAAVSNAGQTSLPILGEVKAWQIAFLVAGIPGLLVALMFLFLPEPKRRFTAAEAETKEPVPLSKVVDHMQENRVFFWSLFVGVGAVNLSVLGSISWLPAMLMRTFEMEMVHAGWFAGAMLIIGGLIGLIGGGALMDRIGGGTPAVRLKFCGWSALIGSIGALIFPITGSIPLLAVSFVLFFSAAAVAVGAAPSTIQQLAPNRMRATISAAYVFAVNAIGLGLGPTLTAWIGDTFFPFESGIRYAIVIVAVSGYLIGALLFYVAAKSLKTKKL